MQTKSAFIHIALEAMFLCLFCTVASATTILYDEAVSGDSPQFNFGYVPLLLPEGDSSIRADWSWPSPGSDDMDSFLLTVPSGQQLTSITLLVSNPRPNGGSQWELIRDSYNSDADKRLGLMTINIDSTGTATQNWSLPFSGRPTPWQFPFTAGTYWFGSTGAWKNSETSPGASFEWQFHVAPVPIPAAAWLLASALGVLSGWRRFGWVSRGVA